MIHEETVYTAIVVNKEGEFELLAPADDCSEEVEDAYNLLAAFFIQLRDSPAFVDELYEWMDDNMAIEFELEEKPH